MCKENFQELKRRLTSVLILTFLSRSKWFIVYNDASRKGLQDVLMQHEKMIIYALRQLKLDEVNYLVHDLELTTVVFTLRV